MDIDVGQVIGGKFELVRLIGRGAMGEVWLAKHRTLAGEFAVKLIDSADDDEPGGAAARFRFEAQVAAKLSRKTRHIVSVSDHGEEGGVAYLVMELLEGESLEARLRRGALPIDEAAAMMSQVARALEFAHDEGIVHRDLKPANVWLGRDEDGRLLVKLLDFGLARSADPARARGSLEPGRDVPLGTPSYMSPEQARCLSTLDRRCDLWALAVVVYEALTTKLPFDAPTVDGVLEAICAVYTEPIHLYAPELPIGLEAFFARAFAPDPSDRFQTATELTRFFDQLVTPEALEEALGFAPAPSSRRTQSSAPPSAERLDALGPGTIRTPLATSRARASLPPGRTGSGTWVGVGIGLVAVFLVGSLAMGALRERPPASALPLVATARAEAFAPVEPPATSARSASAASASATASVSAAPSVERPQPVAPRVAPPRHLAKAHSTQTAGPSPHAGPRRELAEVEEVPPPAPVTSVDKSEVF